MRRMGLISAPTFSSKPRMNAAQDCEAGQMNGGSNSRGRVSEYFSRSSHRSVSFWSLAKSIAYDDRCEAIERDDFSRHTLLTSPRRSIIRYSAFLLSPIRPSKNTISSTRSRSVQILYAWMGVALSCQKRDHRISTYRLEVVVTACTQEVDELHWRMFCIKFHQRIGEAGN